MGKREWSDPVKAMMCSGSAVCTLSLGKGKFGDRMATATYPLLRPEDFPERIRGRAKKVLSARGRVAQQHLDDTTYNFVFPEPA